MKESNVGTTKAELITCHGWGFSPAVWREWEQLLPDRIEIRHRDRGYFGPSRKPRFSKNGSRKVLLVHSFGLHWCPEELLEEVDHLIIIGGFVSFHPEHPEGDRRSRLILRQMMSRFVEKPQEVLKTFYKNVYHPARAAFELPETLNHDRLLHDLDRLGRNVISLQLLHRIPSITIIHGEEDEVVPRTKSHELFNMIRRSRYLEIKKAGHAVAFTNALQCYQFVRPSLEAIE